MNFFVGIIPDDSTNHKIRKVVREVGRVFEGQQIPVRWVNPDTFHVTVLFVGKDISPVRKILLKKKVKKILFKPFKISFKSLKLGIAGKYKELIYLAIDKGDDEVRAITEQLDPQGSIRGANSFIPHLTLGRVSKELTDEESRNLLKDIGRVSNQVGIEGIVFDVREIFLLKSKDGVYEIVMNCSAS
jgi:2'-5' RNA ligase